MKSPIKLKIALQDFSNKYERTLLKPENVNMFQVHVLIQHSIGWENAHLFEFSDKKRISTFPGGIPDDLEVEFGFTKIIDAGKAKLKDVFIEQNDAQPFWYTYDFGDNWEHKISFLKVNQKDRKVYDGIPVCVKSTGKCSPENVGGLWDYAAFLQTISNKEHPEHQEMREWFGLEDEKYDIADVDMEEMNFNLKKYFHSKYWNKVNLDMY